MDTGDTRLEIDHRLFADGLLLVADSEKLCGLVTEVASE